MGALPALQYEGNRLLRSRQGRHLEANGKGLVFECYGSTAEEGARIIDAMMAPTVDDSR